LTPSTWIETTGKCIGRPPADRIPRSSAAMMSGTLRWQGLSLLNVSVMPMMGRASASSE
jgi:hypothetical protein